MIQRLKRILPYFGYGAFYLVVFFFACYLTFPYARLRDRIQAEFAADQKGRPSNQRLEIEELEPYFFTGVRAKGVKVTMAAPPKVGEPDPPTEIEIEELRARVGIFARLFGKTKVSFFARAFGGEIEGSFADSATERKIDVDLSDVSVTRIGPLVAMVGLPMYGALKGHVDLTFPDKRASKGEGSVKLTLADLAVGDGKAKLKGALALPRMNVGELTLDADVAGGVVKLNKMGASGGDLEVAGEGKVQLRDQPSESSTDLYLRFKFSDAYKGRNDTTKSLFGAPGSTAPALFELDPSIKSSKRADGFYGFHMTGMLGSPKFEPFSGSAPGSTSPASSIRSPLAPRIAK